MTRIEKRLLILWFALSFVVWNGVYDMRMHDTVRGYLLETTRAEAGLGRGVDMRTFLARGRVDAIAFSTAWAAGVFLAGLATMYTYRRYLTGRTEQTRTQHQ
jgi:preprotein translocase subunit SecG